MPVPTYDRFIEPILRHLAAHRDGVPAREAHDAAADALGLSAADREERLPSGIQPVYKNRAGWAHDRLKRAGYSTSPRRGSWRLTTAGIDLHARHPDGLPDATVEDIATSHNETILRASTREGASPVSTQVDAPALASPDDRLEAALAELRATTRNELLEVLGQVSPSFFEAIVLDVLHKMGYGASRSDLQRVGGSGDGGIDGIISLDRLGFEKVYVQAKRWQNTVGRPVVQAFYGALAGHRANKGVLIARSDLTIFQSARI